MTQFGAEIAVNGVRPAWLADDDTVQWAKDDNRFKYSTSAAGLNWGPFYCKDDGKPVDAIRLPEDHWAYRAIDAGFEPWGGGDVTPADWDGGDVLHSDGLVLSAFHNQWKWGWPHNSARVGGDIIGYRKRAEILPFAVGTRVHHCEYGDGQVVGDWQVRFNRRPYERERKLVTFNGLEREKLKVRSDDEPITQPDADPMVVLLTEIRDLLKPPVITSTLVLDGITDRDRISAMLRSGLTRAVAADPVVAPFADLFGPSEDAPAPDGYSAAGPWVVPDDGRTPDFAIGSFYQMASEDGRVINNSACEMRGRCSSSSTAYRPLTPEPEPLTITITEPLTITITGPQGSGKTRWAELIRNLPAALLGYPVPVVIDGEAVS